MRSGSAHLDLELAVEAKAEAEEDKAEVGGPALIEPEKGGTKGRSAQRGEAGKVHGGRRRRRKERGSKGEVDMSVAGECG